MRLCVLMLVALWAAVASAVDVGGATIMGSKGLPKPAPKAPNLVYSAEEHKWKVKKPFISLSHAASSGSGRVLAPPSPPSWNHPKEQMVPATKVQDTDYRAPQVPVLEPKPAITETPPQALTPPPPPIAPPPLDTKPLEHKPSFEAIPPPSPKSDPPSTTSVPVESVKTVVRNGPPGGNSFWDQVCVAIPMARRYAMDGTLAPRVYVREMVQKLHEPIAGFRQNDLLIYILNVDKQPDLNTEPASLDKRYEGVHALSSNFTDSQLLKELPDTVMDTFEQVAVTKAKQVWRAKEVLDNVQLLETCQQSGRPYTLFLEDDVFPTSNIWSKLQRFVSRVRDDYAFLNLYNPGVWEAEDVYYNDGDEYGFFCCTQAMLFNNNRIAPIINYIKSGYQREPVDHLLVEYLHSNMTTNNHVYVSVPNLFQHVGAYSTLPERTMDPPEVAHESISWEALLQPTPATSIKRERDLGSENHWSTSFEP